MTPCTGVRQKQKLDLLLDELIDRKTDGEMDRQPYVSGNKPFLPRTSAPSVLRLSIFLRHPQEERHTKAREKRERESVISAPNLNIPERCWVLRL